MLLLRRKIQDSLGNLLLWVDYGLYGLLNLYKYKPFPQSISKIIVIETRNIGDILVITPVLRALKKQYPQAQIDVLVKKQYQQILYGNKNITNVKGWDGTNKSFVNLLKKEEYDIGILLHIGSLRISNALRKSKVKYRIGCTKEGIFTGKGFFLHKKIKPNTKWQHKIEDNLDVIRAINVRTEDKRLEIHAPLEAEQKINKELLKFKVIPGSFFICMHAASQHASQRWYQDRFAIVADACIKKYQTKVVFTGTKEDEGYIHEIIQKMHYAEDAINFAGKTSFHELVALIKAAGLVVSIDTSVVHIASALNTPLIALFGPTVPEMWGPTNKQSKTLWKSEGCTGCRRYECAIKTHECMKKIHTQEVLESIQHLKEK